jgi:transcriptional regulator GlxA family with amidase domain
MNTVAMALFPDFLLLDMAGPLEVFSVANRYLPPDAHYQILTIGTEPGPLRASNGVVVHADLLLEQAQGAYDLLLVPGGPGAYNECHPALLPWLKDAVPARGALARSVPGRSCWGMPACLTITMSPRTGTTPSV